MQRCHEPSLAGDRRPTVGVRPDAVLTANQRLFAALEAAFEVRFAPWRDSAPGCAAVIDAGTDAVASPGAAASFGVPTLALGGTSAPVPATERVHIGDHAAVDRRLRGIILVDQPPAPRLVPAANESVLASSPAGAAWTTSSAPWRVDRVRGALPLLGGDHVLRDGLRMSGSVALLALVGLLRAIVPGRWSAPALRATFVFDDPNLRRPTYGHIDYRQLVAHADEHGYHAAMAMVPLDVRRPSNDAVATFRSRPDRLSLVIHGNDHVRHELMQPPDRAAALALGAQALRRIAGFERETGVGVDRVMMPPHGRCSRHVVDALGALGYEAVCAIHPTPWTQVTPADRILAGWSPAEFIAGCAILPRFPLTVWATEIALRAFLDQPLVLYGHHDDLAGGLEPLADAAARVNRLGDVRWCSFRELARANHATTVCGDVLRVRPWARVLRVRTPAGVAAVTLDAPPGGRAAGFRGWSLDPSMGRAPAVFGDTERVDPGTDLAIDLAPAVQTDPRTVPPPAPRAWPLVRRRATEARDRLAPLWPTTR